MAMVLPNGLIIKEIDTIDVFDITSGDFMFSLDELTTSSIAQTEETQDVTGKGGRLLSRTKKNKGVTVSGSNGVVSTGLMELQTGGEFESENTAEIEWCDILTVKNNAATTTYRAVGTSGAEITELYVKGSSGIIAAELTQGADVAAGVFTYNPATKALAFNTSELADGTEIAVYYKRKIAAVVLDNNSDEYSGSAMMYVNGLAEDKCANVYRVQIYFPKVDFNGNFSWDFGDNQTVHSFEASALAGACGAGSVYYKFIVFGANEDDAQGVTLNKTSTTIVGTASETLVATVNKELTGTTSVTWGSSAQGVATVTDGGVVTGVSAGTTTITATSGTYSATCTVTVTSG